MYMVDYREQKSDPNASLSSNSSDGTKMAKEERKTTVLLVL